MKKIPLLLSIGVIAACIVLVASVVINTLTKEDSNIISTSVTEDLNVTINATNIVTDENGLVNVTYIITISNLLQTNVENIVATNNIAQNLAPYAYTVISLNSENFNTNINFNGRENTNLLSENNTLASGSSGVITLNVSFNPGEDTGPFNNSVQVSGTIPGSPTNNENDNNVQQQHNNEQEDEEENIDIAPVENENENEQSEEESVEIIGEGDNEEENPDTLPIEPLPSTTGGQATTGNESTGGDGNSNSEEQLNGSLTQGSASISFMLQPASSGNSNNNEAANPVIFSQSGSGRLPNAGFNFVNSSSIGLFIAISVILLNIKFKRND